tara:strand:- start:91 stop:1200 length:1110 start_codon:yes stop_codon:yes gene_type:complete
MSTEKLYFQDTATYLYSSTDGQIDVVADGDIVLDSNDDIVLDANGGNIYFKDNGTTYIDFKVDGSNDEMVVTGDFTLDVSGDITLDADGGNIYFNDDTTTYINWYVDGSNDTMAVTGNFIADVSGDITLDADGSNIFFKNGGTTAIDFDIDGTPSMDVTGALTISSNDDITLDSNTDIVLDANGQNIFLKDNGTTFGSLNNSSGGLVIKSGSTSVQSYDSSGNIQSGHKFIQVHHFGHSNLDNGQSTYFSWCSTNSNQSDIFNHRGLMPMSGKILTYSVLTDGALSGGAGPGVNFTLTGSSSSSDATYIDGSAGPGSYRFQSAISGTGEVIADFSDYAWSANDVIVGTITPTTGSNVRAMGVMVIEWTY